MNDINTTPPTDPNDSHDPSSLGPDINACDSEPIHIPGSIQPHGLLLIADAKSFAVRAVAGDIEGRLTAEWQDRTLEQVLGQDVRRALDEAKTAYRFDAVLETVQGVEEAFNAVARRQDGDVLVELEPSPEAPWSATRMMNALDGAGSAFERAASLENLASAAATAFRGLTGFDRVMVYRFLDDDAGVVIAEDCADGIASFMNHHFPASDIPRQARALYVRNRVRVIPNTRYIPAPIRGHADPTAVNLSDVALRSVSPIHLQYLANMDVGASASVSIVKDGLLWGLIACHNRTPRFIPYDVRLACVTLAGDLARQIRAKEDTGNFRERTRLRASEDTVVGRLGGDASLAELFANAGTDLRKMLAADGFAAVQGKDIFTNGRCPDQADIVAISDFFAEKALNRPVATDHLEARYGPAADFRSSASGLLAVTMSTEEPTILMWFRAEQIEEVNWAGNPHKAVGTNEGNASAALTPRASFDAWSEKVRGHSRRWTLEEIEAANRLKRTMFEARQNRRMRELNRDLAATIADKENLIAQKDYLMGEVNHRVQNSLQLVSAFLALQARSANDERVSEHLGEAQRRLSAVGLVHRRLYADDRVEQVDLGRYLEDLVSEMMSSIDGDWGEAMTLDLAPILMPTDRAVNIGLILTELIINANKYAYDGSPGPITVKLSQHRNRFQLIVADQGQGFSGTHEGFGTRMLNAMIARLGGDIERMSNNPGLRVLVTASIESAEDA